MEDCGYDNSALFVGFLPSASCASTMKRTLRWRRRAPSIAAVAAFGALGATCAYWALQLLAPPVAIAPGGSLVDTQSAPDLAAAQALFGSAPSEAAIAGTPGVDVRVLGVAASRTRGSAVLVVGSGTPKAFVVGDDVGDDLRLVEVRSDAAVLERNGARIELPAPQRPSVALLSSGPSAPGVSPAQAAPPIDAREPDAAGQRNAREPAASASSTGGAVTPSPPGAPVVDPARLSGIRASSVRPLGASANAVAPANTASH